MIEMTEYKCGHKTSGVIIMDSNPLSITAYLEWKDSVGFDGDSSQCFDCWCKETKRKQTEQVTLMKYELKKGNVLKEGHTMFIEDVVKDLNYLNNKKMKGGEKYGR